MAARTIHGWGQDWPTGEEEAVAPHTDIVATSASTAAAAETEHPSACLDDADDLGYFEEERLLLGDKVMVRVSWTAKGVDDWIRQHSAIGDRMFGMDIEWRPNRFKGDNNQAALLQLAGSRGCLLVQLLYIDYIPNSLKDMLADSRVKMAGVGVRLDCKKLREDYGLECHGEVDLGSHATVALKRSDLRRVGLAELCSQILGIPLKKEKSVIVSNWAAQGLSAKQIIYAASDAYAAYRLLLAMT